MKKLLLLPVLLMSMLVGCNGKPTEEKETFYTPIDWFKDTDVIENELTFSATMGGFLDYEKVIMNTLTDCFDMDFKFPKKVNDIDYECLMRYSIKKEMGPYTSYTLCIHEKYVEAKAVGVVNNENVTQCVRYDTYGYGTVRTIVAAVERGEEIRKIKKEEQDAAKEVCTLENFYSQIEGSTTNPIATFNDVTKVDVDHALLNDIKDLFIPNNEEPLYIEDKNYFMSYGLNEDFTLKFYLDYSYKPFGVLEYKYQSSLGYTDSVERSYEVDREKVDSVIKKITAITD